MDFLEIINAGGNALTVAIVVGLWKIDRRLVQVETVIKRLNGGHN